VQSYIFFQISTDIFQDFFSSVRCPQTCLQSERRVIVGEIAAPNRLLSILMLQALHCKWILLMFKKSSKTVGAERYRWIFRKRICIRRKGNHAGMIPTGCVRPCRSRRKPLIQLKYKLLTSSFATKTLHSSFFNFLFFYRSWQKYDRSCRFCKMCFFSYYVCVGKLFQIETMMSIVKYDGRVTDEKIFRQQFLYVRQRFLQVRHNQAEKWIFTVESTYIL